ncbi:MAG: glutathione peroxidase [Bacteroidia bacterium]
MKLILFTALTAITMSLTTAPKSIHQFKVKDIDGKVFDFASLKGKKVLIVNTASECGFTKQYAGLEKVYEKYKSKNFVIIGFPCNDFGGQEPGTEADVKAFCSKNFGVTFPLMSKISVKDPNMAPIYKWLTDKAQNGVESSSVKWNFQKYMIDENGNYVNYLLSVRDPDCDKIVNWIEGKK